MRQPWAPCSCRGSYISFSVAQTLMRPLLLFFFFFFFFLRSSFCVLLFLVISVRERLMVNVPAGQLWPQAGSASLTWQSCSGLWLTTASCTPSLAFPTPASSDSTRKTRLPLLLHSYGTDSCMQCLGTSLSQIAKGLQLCLTAKINIAAPCYYTAALRADLSH